MQEEEGASVAVAGGEKNGGEVCTASLCWPLLTEQEKNDGELWRTCDIIGYDWNWNFLIYKQHSLQLGPVRASSTAAEMMSPFKKNLLSWRRKHGNSGNEKDDEPTELMIPAAAPTQKLKIPAAPLGSLYRLIFFIRTVVLALFLYWRITHEITDAIWLWRMSIVCEIWFAFSWLLHHFLESPSPDNPTRKSDLPGIDVSVSTADSEKEPPLVS